MAQSASATAQSANGQYVDERVANSCDVGANRQRRYGATAQSASATTQSANEQYVDDDHPSQLRCVYFAGKFATSGSAQCDN